MFSGAGLSLIAVARSGSGLLPSLWIMSPKYLIFSIKKSHLDSFKLKPYSWILENTLWTYSLRFSTFLLFLNMSSKYAPAKSRSLRMVSITYWKITGATLTRTEDVQICTTDDADTELFRTFSFHWYLKIRVTEVDFRKKMSRSGL